MAAGAAPPTTRERAGWAGLPWPVVAISVGVPLILLAALDSGALRLRPGDIFTGYPRADLIYYSANARELFDNGNGLFYGNPYSDAAASPRVYSHFLFLILGWTWHLTGLPIPTVWQIAQVVFGVLMFVTLYRLVACFFQGRMLTYAFAVVALGDGAAAVRALRDYLATAPPRRDFMGSFWGASQVTCWFPNVFQNALFTTEAFYHVLAFGVFGAVLRNRLGWALVGVFLLWWSHPFTGLECASIVGAYALVEAVVNRDLRLARFGAGVAGVTGLFLAYYIVLLPRWSAEATSILSAWRGLPSRLVLGDAPIMWSAFLFGPLLLLHPRARPARPLADPRARFLVVWIVVVAALVLHDRVIFPPFQPLHFTHGYCFVPLAIVTLLALERLTARWSVRIRRLAAALFLLCVSTDNLLFVRLVTMAPPVALPADAAPVVRYLAEASPALGLVVPSQTLSEYLLVVTSQRVYIANQYLTPFFGEKERRVRRMLESPSPATEAARAGIGWVVADGPTRHQFAADEQMHRVRVALRSGRYALYEITVSPDARGP